MSNFADIPLTMEGLLSALYAAVAIMIIIVLYHLLFIVVDLRKVMRRFEETTEQVEAMILKPLAIIDEAFGWVMNHMQNAKHKKKHKAKEKEQKTFEVEEL